MIKLYNLDHCPYCRNVRQKLDELGLEYELIQVPKVREERNEVLDVSGQLFVPVLIDGNVMIVDDDDKAIIYLQETYGKK